MMDNNAGKLQSKYERFIPFLPMDQIPTWLIENWTMPQFRRVEDPLSPYYGEEIYGPRSVMEITGAQGTGKTETIGRICKRVGALLNRSQPAKDAASYNTIPGMQDEFLRDDKGEIVCDEDGFPKLTGDKELVFPTIAKHKRLQAMQKARGGYKVCPILHLIDDAKARTPRDVKAIMLDTFQTRRQQMHEWSPHDLFVLCTNFLEITPDPQDFEAPLMGRINSVGAMRPTPDAIDDYEMMMFANAEDVIEKVDLWKARKAARDGMEGGPLLRFQSRVSAYRRKFKQEIQNPEPKANFPNAEVRKWTEIVTFGAYCEHRGYMKYNDNGVVVSTPIAGFDLFRVGIEARVGKDAASTFFAYLPQVSFPSVEDYCLRGAKFDFDPTRLDITGAMFGNFTAYLADKTVPEDHRKLVAKGMVKRLEDLPDGCIDLIYKPMSRAGKLGLITAKDSKDILLRLSKIYKAIQQ